MNFLKQQFFYVQKNILNIKMLLALLMIAIWSFLYVQDYITMSQMTNNNFNVLEPAIYLLSNTSISAFLFVLCFIFAFCDIPFEDGSLPYYVYRSGHKKWYFNLLIFTAIFCLLFIIIPILVSILLGALNGFLSFEVWSNMAKLSANGGAPDLAFSPVIKQSLMFYTPIEALTNAILLSFLHYFIIASLLLVFNSKMKKIFGIAFVSGIEILGFILTFNFPTFARFLPFMNSSLTELTFKGISQELSSAPYLWEVYIWFSVAIVVINVLGYFSLKAYKFELGEEK